MAASRAQHGRRPAAAARGAGANRPGLTRPDQISWAQAHHMDLLLAGHTHGGQICVPWIGPILTPSRWGVRYSWGIFHVPPTIMNVTRGVSGVYPLRVNCPPEVVKLVLHGEVVGEWKAVRIVKDLRFDWHDA